MPIPSATPTTSLTPTRTPTQTRTPTPTPTVSTNLDPCGKLFRTCSKESKLEIDQTVEGVDQLTCMANTLLQSLAASCSGINFDYNAILKCNSVAIDSQALSPQVLNYLMALANCKKLEDPNFDVNDFMQRATKAFKFLKFLLSPPSSGLRVPIQCEDGPQSAYGDPCDPSACFVTLRYKVNSARYPHHKNLTDALCLTGPMMCSIDTLDLAPDFEDWLRNVQEGNIAPPYIYTINEVPKPVPPNQKLLCENLLKLKHAILLTGSSCETINGQVYIIYTFKDTYNTIYGQVSWQLRIPLNLSNGAYFPFSIGMTHPFGSSKITSATITNCSAVQKEYQKCCTPTPTPTPTATPAPSVTPTTTPTKLPSTPTPTVTPTATYPYYYVVQQSIKSIP